MTGHPPVASLPMYDWPELRWAHDQLWAAAAERLSARGIEAPEKLDRHRSAEEIWSRRAGSTIPSPVRPRHRDRRTRSR
jgi:hypothetical protein